MGNFSTEYEKVYHDIFYRDYPYTIEVNPNKGYTYYRKIIDKMEVDRPRWNRLVIRSHAHIIDKEIYGFMEAGHAVMFRLEID